MNTVLPFSGATLAGIRLCKGLSDAHDRDD
ncbi:MAG: hypothetical protein RIR62_3031, partial [Pseudomonadota bacterium]